VWPDPAGDPPGDLGIRDQREDRDRDVVAAQREVVERLAVHVDHEGVPHRGDRLTGRVHQHARAVDGHVPLRIAQDTEDRRRLGLDQPLDLEPLRVYRLRCYPLVSHPLIVA